MLLQYIAVLIAAAYTSGVGATLNNLHVKYALWDGFYEIPLSVSQLKKDSNYVLAGHDSDLNVDLYSYPGDPRFFLLFGASGALAGLRTGYIKADLTKRASSKNLTFSYDFDHQPLYKSGTYWNTSVWYTTVLFVNPDSVDSASASIPTGSDGVDVYLPLEGKWTALPKDQCKAESLGFTKQSCFIGMGMHYFYKMKNTAQCSDLPGVFLLYECGQLIGLGVIPFGSFTSKDRTWFEDPPVSVVKEIVPNRPACLLDWVSNYGTSSIHIFFKKYPRLTFCVWPWQRSDQCPKQSKIV